MQQRFANIRNTLFFIYQRCYCLLLLYFMWTTIFKQFSMQIFFVQLQKHTTKFHFFLLELVVKIKHSNTIVTQLIRVLRESSHNISLAFRINLRIKYIDIFLKQFQHHLHKRDILTSDTPRKEKQPATYQIFFNTQKLKFYDIIDYGNKRCSKRIFANRMINIFEDVILFPECV